MKTINPQKRVTQYNEEIEHFQERIADTQKAIFEASTESIVELNRDLIMLCAHCTVNQNAVIPLCEMTFTVDVDAFSILSNEIPLPEGQPLYILGGFSHVMHADVKDLFVDQVPLPALMQTVQPEYSTNIPTSLQVENTEQQDVPAAIPLSPFISVTLRHHFNDLDFNLFDLQNTFIDIGSQFSSPARYLRLDPFAKNANLGGCSYTTHRVEGNGNYHLMKFQCYQLIKSLFYLRTESGYRHNAFDLEPQDFVQNSAKVLRKYQELVTALRQSRTRTFLARAKFTLRYEDGIRVLENSQQEATRILSHQPPVMTLLSTEAVIDYLINMVNGYIAFQQSISNQVDLIH
ncbi:hypothetical protein BD560DRAFT_441366 [Blakeslea trispora]|nr:hypothetical protein BD560DRAFT_441366 [Blakeslea trispora]